MYDVVKHPGWAIRFADDDWLTYGHGWCGGPPSLATIFKTEDEAQKILKEELNEPGDEAGKVVVAWEPLVAKLQDEVERLTKANSFSPDRLWNLSSSLDDIVNNLQEVIDDLKK